MSQPGATADLIARLIEAGTPAALVAEVSLALGRAEGAMDALSSRRASDAARQHRRRAAEKAADEAMSRDITGRNVTSCDVTDEPSPSPLPDKAPHTPKINPSPRPHPRSTRAGTREGTRLPADFAMPADWLEWAMADRGWTLRDAEVEAAAFHDHWIAKPGPDARKLDWQATWRNWVRKSRRVSGNGQRGGFNNGGRPSGWAPRPGMAGAEPASLDD